MMFKEHPLVVTATLPQEEGTLYKMNGTCEGEPIKIYFTHPLNVNRLKHITVLSEPIDIQIDMPPFQFSVDKPCIPEDRKEFT